MLDYSPSLKSNALDKQAVLDKWFPLIAVPKVRPQKAETHKALNIRIASGPMWK